MGIKVKKKWFIAPLYHTDSLIFYSILPFRFLNKNPRSLSFEMEQNKRNSKIDLSSSDYEKRREAISNINRIYSHN